jgi:hypothetical protein
MYQAEWLANIVWAIAHERPIWESALTKAEHRAAELKPKPKTPTEIYLDRRRRLAELSVSPVRRIYHGAVNHLEHQG